MVSLDGALGDKRQLFRVYDTHCAVASSAPTCPRDGPAAGTLGIEVGLKYEALGSGRVEGVVPRLEVGVGIGVERADLLICERDAVSSQGGGEAAAVGAGVHGRRHGEIRKAETAGGVTDLVGDDGAVLDVDGRECGWGRTATDPRHKMLESGIADVAPVDVVDGVLLQGCGDAVTGHRLLHLPYDVPAHVRGPCHLPESVRSGVGLPDGEALQRLALGVEHEDRRTSTVVDGCAAGAEAVTERGEALEK